MNRLDFAESFPEPHLVVRANGHVVSANRAFHEWVRSEAPHAGGSDLLALFADTAKVLSFLRRCARSQRLLPVRLRLQARHWGQMLACEGARFGSPSDHTVLLRMRALAARPAARGRAVRRRLGIASLRRLLTAASRVRTSSPRDRTTAARAGAAGTVNARLRILVVEDDAVNRVVASRMLSRLGLKPDICSDGTEAVERATEQPYDLIFMDVHMPKMDGLEATYRIRSLQRSDRAMRIVALTANTTDDTRDACKAAGMDGFMGKPFTLEDLTHTLTELLPAFVAP